MNMLSAGISHADIGQLIVQIRVLESFVISMQDSSMSGVFTKIFKRPTKHLCVFLLQKPSHYPAFFPTNNLCGLDISGNYETR